MIPKSKEIRVEIINKCNYSCVICKVDNLSRRRWTMRIDFFEYLIDKILKETKQYNTVSFAGIGEPTMNGGLVEMIKFCTQRKLKTLLVSNAEFIDGHYFKRLQDAGLESLRISFHGASPKGYQKIHRKDNFQKVKNNIDEMLKIKKKTKINLTCVMIYGMNKEPVEKWLNLWKGKDIDLFEVWKAHDWVDAFQYRRPQNDKISTCGRLDNGPLQIQADGSINACCFDWDGKLEFGNLGSQNLKEIFRGKEFKKIKKCHDSGKFEKSDLICKHCDQRNADKSDILLYSSKFDAEERVRKTSTSYETMH